MYLSYIHKEIKAVFGMLNLPHVVLEYQGFVYQLGKLKTLSLFCIFNTSSSKIFFWLYHSQRQWRESEHLRDA